MKIVWMRRALSHMKSIKAYISADNRDAAIAIMQRIYSAGNRLTTFPEMGRAGRVPGTRELPIVNSPYLIVYRVEDERVLILAVFHGARRWPKYIPK